MTDFLLANLQAAVELAAEIEPIAASVDCHIGLTGGVLYKNGPRKDIDFVVYKHNTEETAGCPVRRIDFEAKLIELGLKFGLRGPRVSKAEWRGYSIDFIYAEEIGQYSEDPNVHTIELEDEHVPF